ncbi:MAG: hypothetical protein QF415_06930 [Candidatus Undinarchaeales archaeon]|nr:hypothetical protein [Candidatus Undinarchaeales archaeon]MDP7491709.1 hypothetical protein [Candidatus Undinarchaeales archaeon]
MVRRHVAIILALILVLSPSVGFFNINWDYNGYYSDQLSTCYDSCISESEAARPRCRSRCRVQAGIARDEFCTEAVKYYANIGNTNAALGILNVILDTLRNATAARYVAIQHTKRNNQESTGYDICSGMVTNITVVSGTECSGREDGQSCGDSKGICVTGACRATIAKEPGDCGDGSDGQRCAKHTGVCHAKHCMEIIDPYDGCTFKGDRDSCDNEKGVCLLGPCIPVNPDNDECHGKADGSICNGGFGTCIAEKCAALVWGNNLLDFTCKRGNEGKGLDDGELVADGRGICWQKKGLEILFPQPDECAGQGNGRKCKKGKGTCLHAWCVLDLPYRDECRDKDDGAGCYGGLGVCGGGRCLEHVPGAACGADGTGCNSALGICFKGICLELASPFDGCGQKTDSQPCNYFRGKCMYGSCVDQSGTRDRECRGAGTDGYRCNRGFGICLGETCIRTVLEGNEDCTSGADGAPCGDRTGLCWYNTCVPLLMEPEDMCSTARVTKAKPSLDEDDALEDLGEWANGVPCDSGEGACLNGRCVDIARPFECISRPDTTKCDDFEGRCENEVCVKKIRYMPRSEDDFTYDRSSIAYHEKFDFEESRIQTHCTNRVEELMGQGTPTLRPCLPKGAKEWDGCVLGNAIFYEGYAHDPDFFLGVFECGRASERDKRDKCLVGPGPKLVYKQHRTHTGDSCDLEPDERHWLTWGYENGWTYFRSLLRRTNCYKDMSRRFADREFFRYAFDDCARIPYVYKRTECYHTLGSTLYGDIAADVVVGGCSSYDTRIIDFGTTCAADPWKCDEKGDPNLVTCPDDDPCDKNAIAASHRDDCHTECLESLWADRNECYRSSAYSLRYADTTKALSTCHKINSRVKAKDEEWDSSMYYNKDAARHVPCIDEGCFRSKCVHNDKGCGDWGKNCWHYSGTCITDNCGNGDCINTILTTNRGRHVRDQCYHDVLNAVVTNRPPLRAEDVCGTWIASAMERGNCYTQVATNVAFRDDLGGFPRAIDACERIPHSPDNVREIRDSCFSGIAQLKMSKAPYESVPICLSVIDDESLSGCLLNAAKKAKKRELKAIKRETDLPFNTVAKICNKGKRAKNVGLEGDPLIDVIDMCNEAYDRVRTICDLIPNTATRDGCYKMVDPLEAARDTDPELQEYLESLVSGLEGEEQNELAMLARQRIETAKALHAKSTNEEVKIVAWELIEKAEDEYEMAEYRNAIRYADRAIELLKNAALYQDSKHGEYITPTANTDPDALRKEAIERIREAEELYELSYSGRDGTEDIICDHSKAAAVRGHIENAKKEFEREKYIRAIKYALKAIAVMRGQECYSHIREMIRSFMERMRLCSTLARQYNITDGSCRECRLCDTGKSPAEIWRCLVERCVDRSRLLGAICARFCGNHPELDGCMGACMQCSSCAGRVTTLGQDSCVAKCVGNALLGDICAKVYTEEEDRGVCGRCHQCLSVPANLTACLGGCMGRKRAGYLLDQDKGAQKAAGYDLLKYMELKGYDRKVIDVFAKEEEEEDEAPSPTPSPDPGNGTGADTDTGGSGSDSTVLDYTKDHRTGNDRDDGGGGGRTLGTAATATPRARSDGGDDGGDDEVVTGGGGDEDASSFLSSVGALVAVVTLIGLTLVLIVYRKRKQDEAAVALAQTQAAAATPTYSDYSSYYSARQYYNYDAYIQR